MSLWLAVVFLCKGRPRRKTEESPLMGKLFDESGRPLTPIHANKKGASIPLLRLSF